MLKLQSLFFNKTKKNGESVQEPPQQVERKTLKSAMTRASMKAKYDATSQSASTTLSAYVGDLKLNATSTDSTFKNGLSLAGVTLGVEKPGFFMIDYDVPRKATRFQFMSSAKIAGKQAKLTYIHAEKGHMTVLDGNLAFDPANKVSVKYNFASGSAQVKYSYVNKGVRTFEPAYDFGSDSWSFTASHKVLGDDTVKASYDTQRNTLGLEWSRDSKDAGSFKVSASVNIDPEKKSPKLIAERTWSFYI